MQTHKRLEIVYIMSDSPPYEIYGDSKKPEFVFGMADGNWAGIWGYDWSDQIGKNVTKLAKDIIFEIWQPDLRADRVYSAELSERVNHKLFPARLKKNILGNYCYSEKLLKEVSLKNKIIFHTGLPDSFYYEVLNAINEGNKIAGISLGEINIPSQNIFKLRKNQLRTAGHIIDHFKFKKYINRYNIISYLNDKNINKLKKYYKGKLSQISVGIDTSVFKQLDKLPCRKDLNLDVNKKIILSVGRLDSAKQNHELIKILNELSNEFDFMAIFIGHGDFEYEKYLKTISGKLQDKNQIVFAGYVDLNMLVKYYNSADVFFMTSVSEGTPVVSMEALACGVPVVTTHTGSVAEFIKKHSENNVLGIYDYSKWKSVLIEFLKGKKIERINPDLVKEKYSWESVSEKFIEIYRN